MAAHPAAPSPPSGPGQLTRLGPDGACWARPPDVLGCSGNHATGDPMRRHLLSLTLVLSLLSPPLPAREITGQLQPPPSPALPPDATLLLELRDHRGALVAETRLPAATLDAAEGFRLEAPDDVALTLRAAVFDGARPLAMLGPVAVPAGDGPVALGPLNLEPHAQMGFASTLRCGETGLRLGFIGGKARLQTRAGDIIDLQPEPAASGARFRAADGSEFRSKGDAATVTLAGERLAPCVLVPETPPLPLRAVGQEPGWHLDLDARSLELTWDYGAESRRLAAPAPQALPGGGTRLAAEGLRIDLHPGLCRDIATGMPHPYVAEVTLEDRQMQGCGGDPHALLGDTDWQLSELDGSAPTAGRPVVLRFSEGRLSVAGPCNRLTGGYEITGEGLRLGQMAATRMMCDPEAMEVEAALFAALAAVDRFDFDAEGALLLIGADSVRLRARP